MPNDYQMRAPTMKERAGDLLRSLFGTLAEQPLGQIGDALGVTDFTGLSEPQDPDALTLGIMPGPPGAFQVRKQGTQKVLRDFSGPTEYAPKAGEDYGFVDPQGYFQTQQRGPALTNAWSPEPFAHPDIELAEKILSGRYKNATQAEMAWARKLINPYKTGM